MDSTLNSGLPKRHICRMALSREFLGTFLSLVAMLLGAGVSGCSTPGSDNPSNNAEDADFSAQDVKFFAAPTLAAPADGAILTDPRPLFSWQLNPCRGRAVVQICSDAECATTIQSFTSAMCTGARPQMDLALGAYYWRVARVEGRFMVSPWSPSQRFEIAATTPAITADLFGVWSVSSSDVWAVGAQGTILHYNGVWSQDGNVTSQDLHAVWATGDGQAWAVGAAGTIVRRSGSTWALVSSPTTENLWGVWGHSLEDVWAVGDGGLILHWAGNEWTVSLDRMAGSLRGIWGADANDVWAVGGGKEPDGDYAALLLHWNGTSWSESYICNPEGTRFASGGFIAGLSDLWGVRGGTLWAAGQCQSGASFVPYGYVVQKENGANWADTSGFGFGQPLGQYRPLRTIWSSSDNDVWAASAQEMVGGAPTPPTMLHWDGTTWTASSASITVGIYDLGGTAHNDIWAVGKAGKRLHYDGTTWIAFP